MLRRRWEYNITVDLRNICYGDGRWNELTQNRVQWPAAALFTLHERLFAAMARHFSSPSIPERL
jgi:hypothetical protein